MYCLLLSMDSYNEKDILFLEERVLNVLDFDLYLPTTIDFVNIYTDCVAEISGNGVRLLFARYITESSLFYSEGECVCVCVCVCVCLCEQNNSSSMIVSPRLHTQVSTTRPPC